MAQDTTRGKTHTNTICLWNEQFLQIFELSQRRFKSIGDDVADSNHLNHRGRIRGRIRTPCEEKLGCLWHNWSCDKARNVLFYGEFQELLLCFSFSRRFQDKWVINMFGLCFFLPQIEWILYKYFIHTFNFFPLPILRYFKGMLIVFF